MGLEDITIEDGLMLLQMVTVGVGITASYLMYGLSKRISKIKIGTTKLLDAFTLYLAPRIHRPEDIRAMGELAETRARYNI